MADYGIEKLYFSITFVTSTMRLESKIARVSNSLINIARAKIDNKNKSTHVEKKKSAW